MMGVAIVASQLFPGFYSAHGVELSVAIGDSGEDIGLAGVVHKLKRAAVHAAINGFLIAQFDNGYPLPSLGPFIRFPDRDALSRILANLRSSTNSAVGIKTSALDSAFLDDQHFGNKVIADSKINAQIGSLTIGWLLRLRICQVAAAISQQKRSSITDTTPFERF